MTSNARAIYFWTLGPPILIGGILVGGTIAIARAVKRKRESQWR